MTIKANTILFSALALTVLIASIIIFQGYRATNHRLYQTISKLDMINHGAHKIAIEILLDLKDVDSLKKHLAEIPPLTRQLQEILTDTSNPAELVNMEISFVRVKRVVDNLTPGQPISKPKLEQVRNEVIKISENVASLKSLFEQEIKSLQTMAEMKITVLVALLVIYIVSMFFLLFKVVTKPLLILSGQVERVREGELHNVRLSARKDEIGQLAEEFNRLMDKRRQAEENLKQEISQHKEALDKVKLLSGFLPICASCKQIRDDRGYWNQIETYIRDNSEVEFSHSICPECVSKLYPDFRKKDK
ncbi:MAG: methyl-accepting chemotaxis protein [Thermodesulfobacteriota bacterium]